MKKSLYLLIAFSAFILSMSFISAAPGDCSYILSGTTYKGTNNTIGFTSPASDPKFLCLNTRFYECGWAFTNNDFAFEAADKEVIGKYKCNLTSGRWNITADCSARLIINNFYTGTNNTVGLINSTTQNNPDNRFLCLNNRFYECGWNLDFDWFAVKSVDNQVVSNYKCNLASANWINLLSIWKNLEGIPIYVADQDDSVLMYASGQNLDLNSAMNFTVWKNSTFFWFWQTTTLVSPTSSSNIWIANQVGNDIFFKATQNVLRSISIGLNVSSTSSNAAPQANLNLPDNFANYSKNYNISFKQNSTDPDDLLRITWKFGNGASASVNNYSYGLTPLEADVNYSYSSKGIYYVELEAKEMTREQQNKKERTIIILEEGINIVPIISSPLNGATNGEGKFDFNISQSFVANCTIAAMADKDFSTRDGGLNCKYLHAPNLKSTSSGTRIFVNWSMGDGTYKIGNWTENYNSIATFSKWYSNPQEHIATVRLSYYS